MSRVFRLEQAGVSFGPAQVLRGLDLAIHTGESVALVGANGSGKSTLLRLLHGLVPASTGVCEVAPGVRQSMLFQRPFMLRASVLTNVALPLWLRGQRWPLARQQAEQALERVRLQDQSQRPARTLSGGQQQRLALARAWAQQPDVLLLDEPTASLDPHAKREVEQLMAEFAAGRTGERMTVVFASHNLGQVKRLASRVIYLEQGQIRADLPVQDFFDAEVLRGSAPAAHLFVKGELI